MRLAAFAGLAGGLLLMQASPPAQAGLIGDGTNTVSALFFLGTAVPSPPYTSPPPTEPEGTMLVPAHFPIGVQDESTIDVGDTTITITNEANLPFCSSALPCADVFTGFAFTFSAGVDITGVSIDPASAADFRPAGVSPLELLTPTDIIVNLVGENPAVGDQLILDVTTAVTPPPSVPEPATVTLLAVGLGAMLIRQRKGRLVNPSGTSS